MAKICLPNGSGKESEVSEKSGNFEMDIEWQPWKSFRNQTSYLESFYFLLQVQQQGLMILQISIQRQNLQGKLVLARH